MVHVFGYVTERTFFVLSFLGFPSLVSGIENSHDTVICVNSKLF